MIDERVPEMMKFLKERLSDSRYIHSINVAEAARKLAELNGADADKCYLSGLLHDICKESDSKEQIELMERSGYEISPVEWGAPKTHHAIAGAQFVREHYGITDPEIVDPIRWHTVGKGGMNIYEQILFMADLISAERSYPDVDRIRRITYRDLNRGLYEAFKFLLVDKVGQKLVPVSTLDGYNEYTALELKRQSDKK